MKSSLCPLSYDKKKAPRKRGFKRDSRAVNTGLDYSFKKFPKAAAASLLSYSIPNKFLIPDLVLNNINHCL